MRLPIGKIYRAFPELDKFSDVQCDCFLQRAIREQVATQTLAAILAIAVMFAGFWLGGMAVFQSIKFLARAYQVSISQYEDIRFIAIAVVAFICGVLPALYIRDCWLRFAMKRYISAARCPGCLYLLLGLPAFDGALTCPECGRHIVLSDLGLTPQSLIPTA